MTMTQDIPESIRKSPAEMYREWRTMRYQVKQLGKQLGKAGATIYQLRCELAALREVRGVVNPGDYRRLLQQLRAAEAENRLLNEKLAAKEEA